LNTVYSLTVK